MAGGAIIHGPPLALDSDVSSNVVDNLRFRVERRPNGVFRSLGTGNEVRTQTFAETWDRSSKIVEGLRENGVREGCTIVCLQQDILDFVPALWACIRCGCVALPFASGALAADRTKHEIETVLRRLAHPLLLADSVSNRIDIVAGINPAAPLLYLDRLELATSLTTIESVAGTTTCLIPTSGSSGTIKLVALETEALLHRYFSKTFAALSSDTHVLGIFPFDSITGLRAAFLGFSSWTQIKRHVLMARPEVIFEAIHRFGLTEAQATNSLASQLITYDRSGGFDLSSLKLFGLGGETITRSVATQFAAMLAHHGANNVLGAGYGTTETGAILTGADPSTATIDAAGGIQLGGCAAGTSLRVVDDAGELLEEGQTGHVEVRCQQKIFSAYWASPELTRESFTPDHWWKTGDLGAITDGMFAVHGRAKEVLIVNGRKSSLVGIDLHLDHDRQGGWPALSFVMRDPDDPTDRLGIAIVLPTEQAPLEAEIAAIRKSVLRRYGLVPTFIRVASAEVPLTPTGKIDRTRLAEFARGESAAIDWSPGRRSLGDSPLGCEAEVASVWREVFGRDVGRDVDFFEAGGDSFALVQLELEWTQHFGRQIPDGTFLQRATIEGMAARLAGADPPMAQVPDAPVDFIETFKMKQLRLLSNWMGRRVTPSGLVIGREPENAAPKTSWQVATDWVRHRIPRRERSIPVFWILQEGLELKLLFDELGDMEIFGLRSGHLLLDYSGPNLAKVVALYVDEIRSVRPHGPYLLGGICQGALLAVAVARALQRVGETVRLLTIVEFDVSLAFRGEPYVGNVALISGRCSRLNPYRRFSTPEKGWRRFLHDGARITLIDAGHLLFGNDFSPAVSQAIRDAQVWARDRTPRAPVEPPRLPIENEMGHAMTISLDPDIKARCGEIRNLLVTIENQSTTVWGATAESGITVANHWLDNCGRLLTWHDGSSDLFAALAPGVSTTVTLTVTVPAKPGEYLIEIDLVEQGVSWFKDKGDWSRPGYARVHASE